MSDSNKYYLIKQRAVPEVLLKVLEAKRLLDFLQYFREIGIDDIPRNSILREFIGGGCFFEQ